MPKRDSAQRSPSPYDQYGDGKRLRTAAPAEDGDAPGVSEPKARSRSPQKTATAPRGLTLANAMSVLTRYVGSLRNNLAEHNTTWETSERPGGHKKATEFWATVTMPHNSPVAGAGTTKGSPSIKAARAEAAYAVVCQLFAKGEIQDDLTCTPANPAVKPGTLTKKQAKGVVSVEGQDVYDCLTRSQWWAESPPLSLSHESYACVVTYDVPHAERCRPLVLITSQALPLPSATELDISVSGGGGKARLSAPQPLGKLKHATKRALRYTIALLQAVTSRAVTTTRADISYFVLPLRRGFAGKAVTWDDVAWDDVDRGIDDPAPVLVDELDLEEHAISPPGPYEPQYRIIAVRRDLNPLSPDLEGSDIAIDAELKRCGLQPYGKKIPRAERYAVLPGKRTVDLTQPVLECQRILPSRSGGLLGRQREHRLHIPEMNRIHPISASVLLAASLLPDTLIALEAQLIAMDMNKVAFGGRLNHVLVRQALTAPVTRPWPTADTYERLELLGDTMIKFIIGAALYSSSSQEEGVMTRKRNATVSNTNLRESMIASGLTPYIRGSYYPARAWVPAKWTQEAGGRFDEQLPPLPTTQTLGAKVLADVAEALIAAAYLSGGRSVQAALDAMRTLHIPVDLTEFSSLRSVPLPGDSLLELQDPAYHKPLTVLGYTFKDPVKGRLALTLKPDRAAAKGFERLEFLGDGLLDYLTVDALWHAYPDLGPAHLTHMKHSRVGNATFAAFIVDAGLMDQIVYPDEVTRGKLEKLAAELAVAKARADRLFGTNAPEYEYWASVPLNKKLGDILEALLGAILDDADFDLAPAQRVYTEHILPFVSKYAAPPGAHSPHPKSALLVLIAQARCRQSGVSQAAITEVDGEKEYTASVNVHEHVIATATAGGAQLAQRNACAEALRILKARGGLGGLCTCARQRDAVPVTVDVPKEKTKAAVVPAVVPKAEPTLAQLMLSAEREREAKALIAAGKKERSQDRAQKRAWDDIL